MKFLKAAPLVFCICVIFGLSSCTENSGSGSRGKVDTDEETGKIYNPGYEGVLFFKHYGQYSMLDLQSGLITGIRDVEDNVTASEGTADFLTLYGARNDTENLVWFNIDGTSTHVFNMHEYIQGRPKSSPDGQYVAFRYKPPGETPGFVIMKRDGTIVQKLPDNDATKNGASSWEWLPGNDIIVAYGTSLNKYSGWEEGETYSQTVLAELPFDFVYNIALSPQGGLIAFDSVGADTHSHVYVLNLETQKITQLTDSNKDEYSPDWSPDGEHIAFRQGENYVICSDDNGCIVDCSTIFIAHKTADKVFASNDDRNEAYEVLQNVHSGEMDVCARSHLDWRSKTDVLASSPGATLDGDGINKGAKGTIVFRQASSGVLSLDVETGVIRRLNQVARHPQSVSATRTTREIAIRRNSYEQEGFNDNIVITDMDGNTKDIIVMSDEMTGTPKISPDGQYVAIEWHDTDKGDEPRVPIVNIMKRKPVEGYSSELVHRFKGYRYFDWIDDGRLVLSADNNIYVVDESLTTVEHWLSLPNYVSGIKVSPNGNQVAFEMLGHIWKVDLTNQGGAEVLPKKLTTSRMNENYLAWSPDGKHIAVLYESNQYCSQIFIVPSDGERVYVSNSKVEGASTTLQAYAYSDSQLGGVCSYGGQDITWIP